MPRAYFKGWYFICFYFFLQIFHVGNHIFHENGSQMGQMFFIDMENVYCLKPTLEHYACMVELLGFNRAGHFEKEMVFIEKVPPSYCLQ